MVEKKRILLVDDEAFSTEGYKQLLQKDGFVVESVYNGFGALNKFENEIFDIVITNIFLSDKGVLELMENLKNKNLTHKVIAISESSWISASNYQLMIKNFGVTEVLEKPFSLEVLLQRIHNKISS